MKKITLFFIVCIALFTSCKKSRTCECTEYYNGVAVGTPVLTTYDNATPSQAKAACYSYKETNSIGGETHMDCKYK